MHQGTPINADTVATLDYPGLTGIANINLIGGLVDSPPLPKIAGEEYPVITSRPSLFARLDSTMSDLLANLIQTSANINALLNEENRANVPHSIENMVVLTGGLAEQSDQLKAIVANLSVTLDNTRKASAEWPSLVHHFSQSAQTVTKIADQIRGVGENLAAASGDDLTYFTSTTLPDISAMVAELRVASENLRRASETLAQDPSVLVYGSPAPKLGPGE